MQRTLKYLAVLSLLLFLIIGLSIVAQSQEGASTATPAPSKTPQPTITPAANIETDDTTNTEFPRKLARSYTQADLSVLVGNVQRPNGIVWFDNHLYTACNGDWTLYRVDDTSGETITFVFGLQNAHDMVAETTDDGFNIWAPDFDTNRLLRIDQRQGAPLEITSDKLDGPWGITPINDEHFLISNVRGNNIVMTNRLGEVTEVINGLRSPAGMASDGDYVYVANNGSARRAVEWFNANDLSEDEVTDITQPLVSGLQNASSLVMAEDGFLYFTYALGTRGVVGRVDPVQCRDDGCTNEDVEIVVFTELQAPLAGLTITPDMRLFVHTIFRPEIYWVRLYDELPAQQLS